MIPPRVHDNTLTVQYSLLQTNWKHNIFLSNTVNRWPGQEGDVASLPVPFTQHCTYLHRELYWICMCGIFPEAGNMQAYRVCCKVSRARTRISRAYISAARFVVHGGSHGVWRLDVCVYIIYTRVHELASTKYAYIFLPTKSHTFAIR